MQTLKQQVGPVFQEVRRQKVTTQGRVSWHGLAVRCNLFQRNGLIVLGIELRGRLKTWIRRRLLHMRTEAGGVDVRSHRNNLLPGDGSEGRNVRKIFCQIIQGLSSVLGRIATRVTNLTAIHYFGTQGTTKHFPLKGLFICLSRSTQLRCCISRMAL